MQANPTVEACAEADHTSKGKRNVESVSVEEVDVSVVKNCKKRATKSKKSSKRADDEGVVLVFACFMCACVCVMDMRVRNALMMKLWCLSVYGYIYCMHVNEGMCQICGDICLYIHVCK